MIFRTKGMSERNITVIVSGMHQNEAEETARKIRETIRKENRLSTNKSTYKIIF